MGKRKAVHGWRGFVPGLCFAVFGATLALASPAAAQDHQYGAEQIQAGYRIYVSQCQLCHGNNGDGIARVNLSRQQFPHAVTDDDIRKVITTGNPAGMPPFALKTEELDNLVAFVRSGMDRTGTAALRQAPDAR